MPGGLLQLMAYGSQNEYLNGNPQMTFFKIVYKRYTNFSMEYIRQNLEGPRELDLNNNVKLSCKVSRNADLIFNTFFVFNLPDIYSGYDSESNTSYKFNWVQEIGNVIIYRTTLNIGGSLIDQQYGDWMSIWSQFNIGPSLRPSYDVLIGNTPDLYDPGNQIGNNGFYPTSTLDESLDTDPDFASVSYINLINPFERAASILQRKIYVPLTYWFCNNSGLALPLIALQYHDIIFEVELRPITDLYTIIETDINSPDYGQRVKPAATRITQSISNFIIAGNPQDFPSGIPGQKSYKGHNIERNTYSFNGWNLDPHLLINYIFLDHAERKKFAQTSHEYLITQVYREEHLGVIGNKTLNLNLHHPVKQLIWTTRRDDMINRNIYNNFTNWENKNINPFTASWINQVTQLFTKTNLSLDIVKHKVPTKSTFKYFLPNILKNASINFEGEPREREHDHIFYNYLQPFTTSLTNPDNGVYMYSFELDNYKFQPSGSCNMSRIKKIGLNVETQETPSATSLNQTLQYKYTYDFYVYSVNYNVLRIMAGMAGLTFSN